MSGVKQQPRIVDFYTEYQKTHDTADFIANIQRNYTESTLIRLAVEGNVPSRRASSLALGFIGSEASNAVLGKMLHDPDLSVRLMAENSIKNLWPRIGNEQPQRELLRVVMRLVLFEQYEEAIEKANILVEEAPFYAEARNQRSIAFFGLKQFEQSILDCRECLELNPFHFGAAVAMGYAHCRLHEINDAIHAFEWALSINPNLGSIRRRLQQLTKSEHDA